MNPKIQTISGRKHPWFMVIVLLAVMGFYGEVPHVAAGGTGVGMNLNSVKDWVPDHVFVDVFKKSRNWITRNADGSGEWSSGKEAFLPTNEQGWPTQVPFLPSDGSPAQIVHTLVTVMKEGVYTLFYEGCGTFRVGTSGGASREVVADGIGEKSLSLNVTLDENGEGIIWLEILRTDSTDYLRQFRIITPGFESDYVTAPFYPVYEEKLQNYSVLRFMDWGQTNGSPIRTWADRTRPDHNTQARDSGVALEYMILLANRLHKHPWICIPHMADDDFVEQTALMLKSGVSQGLKIYVEYSNETWNTAYPFGTDGTGQTDWVQDQGEALGLSSDRWTAGQKYVALRSAQIWNIFELVFGAESAGRLIRVTGTQSRNVWITTTRLEALADPAINPFDVRPDVLAVAPYFGGDVADSLVVEGLVDTTTVPEILNKAGEDLRQVVPDDLALQKNAADLHDVWLLTYEGGQHLVGTLGNENNAVLTEKLISANRDFQMADLYQEYMAVLNDFDIPLLCHFSYIGNPSKWGSWGALESINQPDREAPKYSALNQWTAAHSPTNIVPKARVLENIMVSDVDGDGEEPVRLDGTPSRDLDGTIVDFTWIVAGAQVATGPTAIVVLPAGTHTVELEIRDNDGATDRTALEVAVEGCGQPSNLLVEADFAGTSPAANTPWTAVNGLASGIAYSGWTLGPGGTASETDDVFAWFLDNEAELSTLSEALDRQQYAAVQLAPETGCQIDLSGEQVRITVRRFDNHGGHRYAVFSNIDGFKEKKALFISPYYDSWSTEDAVLEFNLPSNRFSRLTKPFELRVYPFEAQYAHKETSIAGFSLHGTVQPAK